MEYRETQPITDLFGDYGFTFLSDKFLRLDHFSNCFHLLSGNDLISPFVTFRNFYLDLPPLFLDFLGVDKLGFGGGVGGRFSLTHVSSFYDWGSFPHVVELQLGARMAPLFSIPSMAGLYSGMEWVERECWDMFGIIFDGNRDLRRLLTDYGFSGFPLRRDFPVVGFVETHYDDETFQLRLEKISLAQEMRPFLFQSGGKIV